MATADDVETYRRHAGELIRYATVLVGPDDAADVVSDAVLAAFATPGWRDVANRRAYLYRAVLHRSASHHRTTARRRRRETSGRHGSPRRRRRAAGAGRRRPPGAWRSSASSSAAVVFLTYWEDQTPAQIADLLGVSEGTVRKQLARAREHLRRILDA